MKKEVGVAHWRASTTTNAMAKMKKKIVALEEQCEEEVMYKDKMKEAYDDIQQQLEQALMLVRKYEAELR